MERENGLHRTNDENCTSGRPSFFRRQFPTLAGGNGSVRHRRQRAKPPIDAITRRTGKRKEYLYPTSPPAGTEGLLS